MKTKSARNKTVDFPLEEAAPYLDRCVKEDFGSFEELRDRTILGDAFEVLERLPDRSVDLVIADPYYNLSKSFHGNASRKQDFGQYAAYTERWVGKVARKLKPDGSIYVCCDWKSSGAVEQVLQRHFIVRNRITWQREKGRGAGANWKNAMEDIWFATCSETYTFNLDAVRLRRRVRAPYRIGGKPRDWEQTQQGRYRDTCPSNFWDDISIPYWSMAENTAHPAQKPEKLIAKLILASSRAGDIVLDPFLGSGTTSVVARKLGRSYIGIEQNPLYCAWAEYRLEKALGDTTIQGYTDGRFWERNSCAEQLRIKKEGARPASAGKPAKPRPKDEDNE